MPRNVLLPTDGSPLSKEAFEHAIDTFPDGNFTLIHVTRPRYIVLNNDNLNPEEKFTELIDLAERHDIEVETETRTGRPSREIVTYSEENDIDEIVIGSHGRERLSRILLGSVVERVLRRAPVPVTIVRPNQRTGERHHLVPIDGSEQSRKALEYAFTVFPNVETTVLHAIDPMETHYGEGQLVHTPTQYEQIEAKAEQLVADAEDLAHEYDVNVATAVFAGQKPNRPVNAILEYVEDNDIDHLIMGSHGRSGASRLLLGSVAETVARRSPAPVTVVR